MKKLLYQVLFLLISSTSFSQSCLPEGIIFTSQAQIDSFQVNYPNCTEIEGEVEIGTDSVNNDITNLNGLIVLTSIRGSLWIHNNDFLPSLSGLNNLVTISGYLTYISMV